MDNTKIATELEVKLANCEIFKKTIDLYSFVLKIDRNRDISYVNNRFLKATGYDKNDLIGKSYRVLKHPDMFEKFFDDLEKQLLIKNQWRGTIRVLCKNDNFLVADSIIFNLNNKNIDGDFLFVATDITASYFQKDKEKLEIKNKFLEESNKSKDNQIVFYTHELKTPLNAIINFSAYIEKNIEKITKTELLDLVKEIKNNGLNTLENVNDLLDISKAQRDKLIIQKKHFNLNLLIEEMIGQYSSLVDGFEINFSQNIANCEIFSDKKRLKKILSNIYSNAIKYSKGVVHITLDSRDGMFELSFEDNGNGVVNKSKVFELFKQDDENDIEKCSKGTGIGLYFTKILSIELGYNIELFDSETLGGAHFKITGNLL